MKIVFTGGGSGGHFYPIVAIIEALRDIEDGERLVPADLYFISDAPYDSRALFEHAVSYIEIKTGKRRLYFSLLNFIDIFRTFFAILKAIRVLYGIFPDVVFGKGGYVSFPTLVAARLFRIPVIVHESDSVPGRANLWAAKFAKAIAVAYPDSAKFFPESRVVVTGNPIRREVLLPISQGAHKFLSLEEGVPVLFVLGGSQGAAVINEIILDALPFLLDRYQILHQVGEKNKEEIEKRLEGAIGENPHKTRYKMHGFLNDLSLRMSAGVADLIISRAGASSIFEIASWGKPAILIPIAEANGDHQRKNAFHYARSGAALVIEEANLSPHLLEAEINRILDDKELREKMKGAARQFAEHNVDSADKIARAILRLGLEHE